MLNLKLLGTGECTRVAHDYRTGHACRYVCTQLDYLNYEM